MKQSQEEEQRLNQEQKVEIGSKDIEKGLWARAVTGNINWE